MPVSVTSLAATQHFRCFQQMQMAHTVSSFHDYRSLLTKKLRSLRHFERCLFSAWCAEHLLTRHAAVIEKELSVAHSEILRQILDAIWQHLLEASIPSRNVLNELDGKLMDIEPDDPGAAIEVHPIATSVRLTIGFCILGCRRKDVRLAQNAGEAVITILDYELDEKDRNYSGTLDKMFDHPEMKQELEAQLAMIDHLRKGYVLDEQLRTAFRRRG